MAKFLYIVDSFGEHKYKITKETEEAYETNSVTLLDEYPIRYNKKEERLEYFNGEYWDIYVPQDCIFDANVTAE